MTAPSLAGPPVTLASLAFDWGDAYMISSMRDRWVALRRDARYFLVADTLADLEAFIISDYRDNPVPRDYDPPGAGDYLESAGRLTRPSSEDSIPEDDAGLDAETLITVRELRRAFLLWTIIYCTQTRTWIGRTRTKTISHSSAVSLSIALTLIERRERQLARSPGWNFPPWQQDPAQP
jgi:hypothetical protein